MTGIRATKRISGTGLCFFGILKLKSIAIIRHGGKPGAFIPGLMTGFTALIWEQKHREIITGFNNY